MVSYGHSPQWPHVRTYKGLHLGSRFLQTYKVIGAFMGFLKLVSPYFGKLNMLLYLLFDAIACYMLWMKNNTMNKVEVENKSGYYV